MSPQKENGYTAIANEIMEALIKYPIAATQMQCLLMILRKTYGYNKKTDAISLSQFEKFTNLDRRHIHRAVKELQKKNIIKVIKRSAKNGTKKTTEYRFNKVYTSWVFVPKMARGSAKNGTNGSAKIGTDKRQYLKKEKNIPHLHEGKHYLTKKKKKLSGKRLDTFELFWEIFNYKLDKASAADSWLEITLLTDNLVDKILKSAKHEANIRQEKIDKGQTPKYAQGWISARRWEDEFEDTGKKLSKEETLRKYGL